jgi:hypothetical protein
MRLIRKCASMRNFRQRQGAFRNERSGSSDTPVLHIFAQSTTEATLKLPREVNRMDLCLLLQSRHGQRTHGIRTIDQILDSSKP